MLDRDIAQLFDEHFMFANGSDYSEIEELSGVEGDFRALHMNVHSMVAKKDLVIDMLNKFKNELNEIDVLMVCETFMNSINVNQCNLPEFNMEFKHRSLKAQGGVAVYINKQLSYKNRPDLSLFYEGIMECCFVELLTKNNKDNIIIGEIYRIPGTDEHFFLDEYTKLLTLIKKENKKIIIGTDQNLDFLKIDKHNNTEKMLDINLENNMIPTITKPTRITYSTATLIDNIYISNQLCQDYKSFIITEYISDHLPCLSVIKNIKTDKSAKSKKFVKSRKFNQEIKNAINEVLIKTDWRPLTILDAEQGYNFFDETLQNTINILAPEKKIKVKNKNILWKPWMTPALLRSSYKVNRLYKKTIGLNKTSKEYIKFVTYRTQFNKIKRKTKQNYYSDLFIKYKNDSKKSWKLMNELIGKTKNKQEIPDYMIKGSDKIYNKTEISNEFCDYFTNVGPELATKIPNSDHTFKYYFNKDQECHTNSFFMNPTTEHEIIKIINNLSNKYSSGFDKISNNLLKGIKEGVSLPLAIIFNKSMEEGVIPDKLKFAEILPVYKNKSKHEFTNYRPVSLLPCLSKILEKIIYSRLYNYLNYKNILFEGQYGFRNKRGTIDAVTDLLGNIITDLDKKLFSLGLFIDLSKAFDTIDFNILLYKLENYGIRGTAFKWFDNYLKNRKQRVILKNEINSKTTSISHGVPQGSVLGPLLFLIYINDLSKNLIDATTIAYADDTTIYLHNNNLNDLFTSLHNNIVILIDWCNANKLSINLMKTKYMLFQIRNKINNSDIPTITINNTIIERVNSFSFLGVKLSESLNWHEHATHVAKKLKQNLYLLNNIKDIIPKTKLIELYYAHIYSHIIYASHLWGPMLTNVQLNKIYQEQKRALRYIENKPYMTNYDILFKQNKLLKIKDIIELETLKFAYKINNNMMPKNINNFFENPENIHNYNTRNRRYLRTSQHKTKLYNNSIFAISQKKWLQTPNNIKTLDNIKAFANKVKEIKIAEY